MKCVEDQLHTVHLVPEDSDTTICGKEIPPTNSTSRLVNCEDCIKAVNAAEIQEKAVKYFEKTPINS